MRPKLRSWTDRTVNLGVGVFFGLRLAFAVFAVLSVQWTGCTTNTKISECAEDRQQLERTLAGDQRIDQLLHAADALASKGQAKGAESIITQQARPLAASAIDQAQSWNARTRWGQARRQEGLVLLQDRMKSMDEYAEALRSDEVQRVVDQMSAQRTVEQRAMELDRRVRDPVSLTSGDCDRR
jgi:hypothetical protein